MVKSLSVATDPNSENCLTFTAECQEVQIVQNAFANSQNPYATIPAPPERHLFKHTEPLLERGLLKLMPYLNGTGTWTAEGQARARQVDISRLPNVHVGSGGTTREKTLEAYAARPQYSLNMDEEATRRAERAIIGTRPLQGLEWKLKIGGNFNIQHHQFLFIDRDMAILTDLGLFPGGIRQDEQKNRARYELMPEKYDAGLIREAIFLIADRMGDLIEKIDRMNSNTWNEEYSTDMYVLFLNNCQHFVSDVLKEADVLAKKYNKKLRL